MFRCFLGLLSLQEEQPNGLWLSRLFFQQQADKKGKERNETGDVEN